MTPIPAIIMKILKIKAPIVSLCSSFSDGSLNIEFPPLPRITVCRSRQRCRHILGRILVGVSGLPVPIHICHNGKAVHLPVSLLHTSGRIFLYSLNRKNRSILLPLPVLVIRIPDRTYRLLWLRIYISMHPVPAVVPVSCFRIPDRT